jgi:hypothetical protein
MTKNLITSEPNTNLVIFGSSLISFLSCHDLLKFLFFPRVAPDQVDYHNSQQDTGKTTAQHKCQYKEVIIIPLHLYLSLKIHKKTDEDKVTITGGEAILPSLYEILARILGGIGTELARNQ